MPAMSRAEFMTGIGPVEHPPSEAMWEALEAQMSQVKRASGVPGMTDAEALATDAGQQAITAWKRRNKLSRR